MARITLHRKPLLKKIMMPYWVFINGQPIGIMRGESVSIELPEGTYRIGVKLLFKIWKWQFGIGGENVITASELIPANVRITDRERLWNILFDIDLVVWIASFFFTLSTPWNVVYHALSDGFFIVWVVRIIIIRNRYFKLINESN